MLEKKEVLLSLVAQISSGPFTHCLLMDALVRGRRECAEKLVTCKESRGVETSLTVNTLFFDGGLLLIKLHLQDCDSWQPESSLCFHGFKLHCCFHSQKNLSLEKICRR